MGLREEEKRQLKKIIEGTGVAPPGLQDYIMKKKLQIKKEGPVLLILQDEKKDTKNFELTSVRKKNGLLGHEMEIPLSTVMRLGERSRFSPWIIKIVDDKEQVFPYYHGDSSKIIFSPTFYLIKNKDYQKDKINPYNVPLAGFLFIYNSISKKNYLEAVSGSVVANVAVTENLMARHREPYSRENHILNWLAFLGSRDSKDIIIQAFSMHTSFVSQHREYLNKLAKKN